MPLAYRVVDLRTTTIDALDIVIEGVSSPEEAARRALDMDVVRSGPKHALVARVYWQLASGPVNMVRLYQRIGSDLPEMG